MNTILNEFFNAVMPALLQLIAFMLGILLIRAAAVAKARWGVEIEANDREALHSALMSGIRAALLRGVSGRVAIGAAIAHATTSVPDALGRLKPEQAVLEKLAEAKLQEELARTPAPVAEPSTATGEAP